MIKKVRVIMTGSISSIGSFTAVNGFSSTSGLSDETKKKLIALGLNPASYKSDEQALAAISKILVKMALEKSSKSSSEGKREVFSKVAGLSISKGESIENFLSKVLSKISEVESSLENNSQNNLAACNSASGMKGACALANYNKVAFGLI